MYLRVFFPSGRFYGAELHDPSLPEWPPHPSRLYSALVASAYRSGGGMTENKRKALKWFESLAPPSVALPAAELSNAPVSYVPPGDVRGQKGKKGQEQYEHGIHRWRQPRYFPSAFILGDSVVSYGWEEDPDMDIFAALEKICQGVTHVGTSHSVVAMKITLGTMPYTAGLEPHPSGDIFLRVPAPGRLLELDEAFDQTSGVRRPAPTCEYVASYRQIRFRSVDDTRMSELLTLRISGSMHGADTSEYLGRTVRRAVMSILGDDAPPAIHGHNGGMHVGWLPLPDVGHAHATGRIVGMGIMLPAGLNLVQRRKVLAGIGSIDELRLPDGRRAKLSPPTPGQRVPVALSQRTWIGPSSTWATVTPVVLDRPPKRLIEERIRKALSESLIFSGHPEPSDVKVASFSVFRGAPPAFRVSAEKPRYHATVRFEESITGPVIAGRLRYFGVGLFRPLPSSNALGDPK